MNRRRSGYTLLELVLVTAVIAMTAAMAAPSLDGMYPSYKLNASIDAVRAAWAKGRALAIEEGRPYRFAVTPGQSKYRLGPDEDPTDGGQLDDSTETNNNQSRNQDEELPKGVTFSLVQQSESQPPQWSSSPPPPTNTTGSTDGMSTIAVFLPDGTARDDAEITIQVKGAAPKSVKLRGLTGAVTVQQSDGGGPR